ncbi:hypothetical protein CEUSTIGMA_g9808.t1 [Chlamydomonas eustigma]|uniref:Uncharacterized protein n=1 Tax=Chlamydomonas eustigma TaxID=1157962 RepID=A0A250XHV2_9CHLO|nr:hypothetical protein CEUSTIGMA_g9808.t1 [Chlamydomonas eustigma]|eukprot:GAX82380.1 hypothetical protein CEUSTIGMA_g9808.t1 [Chlamydomonas eustigma]
MDKGIGSVSPDVDGIVEECSSQNAPDVTSASNFVAVDEPGDCREEVDNSYILSSSQGRPYPEKISDLNVDIDAANKAVSNALAGILSSSLPPSSSKAPSRSSLDVQPTASLSKAEPLLHRHRQVVNRSHSLSSRALHQASSRMVMQSEWTGQCPPRGGLAMRYPHVGRAPSLSNLPYPALPEHGSTMYYSPSQHGLMHTSLNLIQQQQQQQQQLIMRSSDSIQPGLAYLQVAQTQTSLPGLQLLNPNPHGSLNDMQMRASRIGAQLAAQQQQQQQRKQQQQMVLLPGSGPGWQQAPALMQQQQQQIQLLYQQQQQQQLQSQDRSTGVSSASSGYEPQQLVTSINGSVPSLQAIQSNSFSGQASSVFLNAGVQQPSPVPSLQLPTLMQQQQNYQTLLKLYEEVSSGLISAAGKDADKLLEQQLNTESSLLVMLLDLLVRIMTSQVEEQQAVGDLDCISNLANIYVSERRVVLLGLQAGGGVLTPGLKLALQCLSQVFFTVCPLHRQDLHQSGVRVMAAFTSSDPDVGSVIMQQLRNHMATPQPEHPQQRDMAVHMLMDLANAACRVQQALHGGSAMGTSFRHPTLGMNTMGISNGLAQVESGDQNPVRHSSGFLIQTPHGPVMKRPTFPFLGQLYGPSVPSPSATKESELRSQGIRQGSMATTWEEEEGVEEDGDRSAPSVLMLPRDGLPPYAASAGSQVPNTRHRPLMGRLSSSSLQGGSSSRGVGGGRSDGDDSGSMSLLGEAFQGLDISGWLQQDAGFEKQQSSSLDSQGRFFLPAGQQQLGGMPPSLLSSSPGTSIWHPEGASASGTMGSTSNAALQASGHTALQASGQYGAFRTRSSPLGAPLKAAADSSQTSNIISSDPSRMASGIYGLASPSSTSVDASGHTFSKSVKPAQPGRPPVRAVTSSPVLSPREGTAVMVSSGGPNMLTDPWVLGSATSSGMGFNTVQADQGGPALSGMQFDEQGRLMIVNSDRHSSFREVLPSEQWKRGHE